MLLPRYPDGINCSTFLNKKRLPGLTDVSVGKGFSLMGINGMLLVVWLGENK